MAPGSVSVAVKEPTMVPVGWFSRMESAPFAFKLVGGILDFPNTTVFCSDAFLSVPVWDCLSQTCTWETGLKRYGFL